MSAANRADVIRELRDRIRGLECRQRPAREPAAETPAAEPRSLGEIGFLLPGREPPPGSLIEWLSEGPGAGAATLALIVAARSARRGEALVVIDSRHEFYPPAAASLGIPPEQMVIVRPAKERDALWAWEQALRSGAAAVVLGWLGSLGDRAFRRLQLAAEMGNSQGFLLRPAACRVEPSWAELRLLVRALPTTDFNYTRRLLVELLHRRGGVSGETVELELNDEPYLVRLASRLAPPAVAARTAGA